MAGEKEEQELTQALRNLSDSLDYMEFAYQSSLFSGDYQLDHNLDRKERQLREHLQTALNAARSLKAADPRHRKVTHHNNGIALKGTTLEVKDGSITFPSSCITDVPPGNEHHVTESKRRVPTTVSDEQGAENAVSQLMLAARLHIAQHAIKSLYYPSREYGEISNRLLIHALRVVEDFQKAGYYGVTFALPPDRPGSQLTQITMKDPKAVGYVAALLRTDACQHLAQQAYNNAQRAYKTNRTREGNEYTSEMGSWLHEWYSQYSSLKDQQRSGHGFSGYPEPEAPFILDASGQRRSIRSNANINAALDDINELTREMRSQARSSPDAAQGR